MPPHPHRRIAAGFLLSALTAWPNAAASAAELRIVDDESVFAVVTHKAGFASGRAHNHFITAGTYRARLEAAEGSTGFDGALFEIEVDVESLVVDASALQSKWYPRLEGLGILAEPFGEPDDDDRAKIRDSMLGPKQLDAANHATIRARLAGLVEKPAEMGSVELGYEATLVLEVRGQSAERPLSAQVSWSEGVLQVEAAGVFHFTDFGIKPFSAFLGAVRNTDEFHLYVSLRAVP